MAATISCVDDEKNSPVHICASRGHVELLKYFLERYPQADCKNIYGKTPLDLSKNDKIKELLKDYLIKNTYQYHKITIYDTNNKCANNLIYGKNDIGSNGKKKSGPKFGGNLVGNNYALRPNHNKFQSNDFNSGINNNYKIKSGNETNNNGQISNNNVNITSNSVKTKKIANTQNGGKSYNSNSSAKSTTTFNTQIPEKIIK